MNLILVGFLLLIATVHCTDIGAVVEEENDGDDTDVTDVEDDGGVEEEKEDTPNKYVLNHITLEHLDKPDKVDEFFNKWKEIFDKSYVDKETEDRKKELFLTKLKEAVEHNLRYTNGETSYFKNWSTFFDKEISNNPAPVVETGRKRLLGSSPMDVDSGVKSNVSDSSDSGSMDLPIIEVTRLSGKRPPNWDWRKVRPKMIPPVIHQKECSSCYAIASLQAIAAQRQLRLKRSSNPVENFSVQQVVDCSKDNYGCKGGYTEKVYEYAVENVLLSQASYPYKGKDQDCLYEDVRKKHYSEVKITSYGKIGKNEKVLMGAVYCIGPVVVSIDPKYFDDINAYGGGIYDEEREDANKTVDKDDTGHVALLVGYGVKMGKGKIPIKYWILLFAWGEEFGEQGFVRVVRGKNQLKIADDASFPIIDNNDVMENCIGDANIPKT